MLIDESLGPDNYKTYSYYLKNNELLTELCDKYGSDKGSNSNKTIYNWPAHSYTQHYSKLFSHCRNNIKLVFECGIGSKNPKIPSSMGINGIPGASLRVWKEYFPNAKIIGADIDLNTLFEEDRISTYFVDQTSPDSINLMWEKIGLNNFDLIIDDGWHNFNVGFTLFENSIDRLVEGGLYIIEDVQSSFFSHYINFFKKFSYSVEYINMYRPRLQLADNSLIIIRK